MVERLTKPLLKENGSYRPLSFNEAFQCVQQKLAFTAPNKTLMMASGDYSNEELYMLQRLARAGFRTNALGSLDYYRRGTDFFIDKNDIVPFAELFASDLLLCMLDENAHTESAKSIRHIIDNCKDAEKYDFNIPNHLQVTDYAPFFRALCWYLIHNDLAKGIYVNGLGKNYAEYKATILKERIEDVLSPNKLTMSDVEMIIGKIRAAKAPAFVIWEPLLDARAIIEVENLCMLLDIQAKPCSGFLTVKRDLNSQGLFDMGFFPQVCVGGIPFDPENRQLMCELYGCEVVTENVNIVDELQQRSFANCFVWNATGKMIADEIMEAVRNASFTVLQTAYWEGDETDFDLLLPASLPAETEGSYTDSARIPHNSKPADPCPLEFSNLQMFSALGCYFGLAQMTNTSDIFMEYISFLRGGCRSKFRHFFR